MIIDKLEFLDMKNIIGMLLLALGLSGCSTTYSGLFRYDAGDDFSSEGAVVESLKKIASDFGLKKSESEALKRDEAYGFSRGTFDAVPEGYKDVDGSDDSILLNYYPLKQAIRITSLSASKETEFIATLKDKLREMLEAVPGIEGVRFEEVGYEHSVLGP